MKLKPMTLGMIGTLVAMLGCCSESKNADNNPKTTEEETSALDSETQEKNDTHTDVEKTDPIEERNTDEDTNSTDDGSDATEDTAPLEAETERNEDTEPGDDSEKKRSDSEGTDNAEQPEDSEANETEEDVEKCPPDGDDFITAYEYDYIKWSGDDLLVLINTYETAASCDSCSFNHSRSLGRIDNTGERHLITTIPAQLDAVDIAEQGTRFAVTDAKTIYVYDTSGEVAANYDYSEYVDIRLSPDGQTALLRQADTREWHRADVPGETFIKNRILSDHRPIDLAWSPDGSKVAYIEPFSEKNIVVLSLEDESVITIPTEEPRGYYKPIWTTDGTAIMYVEAASLETTQERNTDETVEAPHIYRVDATGGGQAELVMDTGGWISPNSSYVADRSEMLMGLVLYEVESWQSYFRGGGIPCG